MKNSSLSRYILYTSLFSYVFFTGNSYAMRSSKNDIESPLLSSISPNMRVKTSISINSAETEENFYQEEEEEENNTTTSSNPPRSLPDNRSISRYSIKNCIHNSLLTDRLEAQVLKGQISWGRFWEESHLVIKMLSTAVDIIGGVAIGTISALESDYTDETHNSYKRVTDITQMGFGFTIVTLKIMDLYLDRKLAQSILAKEKLSEKREECQRKMIEKLKDRFIPFQIENTVNEYMNITEDNLETWLRPSV